MVALLTGSYLLRVERLNKYGGGTIPNLGSATLKVTYCGRSTLADFKIVDVPNSPSILGCKQALELGLITLNVNSLNVTPPVTAVTKNDVAATGKLTRSDVLKSYGDSFDKPASSRVRSTRSS